MVGFFKMNIESYTWHLNNLIDDIDKEINNIIQKKKNLILRIIRTRLYQKSLDGNLKEILPSYSKQTELYKKEKRQIRTRVTLRDTGEWYKSFQLLYENGDLTVISNLDKTDFLVDKYGSAILEFTDEEIKLIYDSIIEPHLLKLINKPGQIKIDF
jgi:hypothetical protein